MSSQGGGIAEWVQSKWLYFERVIYIISIHSGGVA